MASEWVAALVMPPDDIACVRKRHAANQQDAAAYYIFKWLKSRAMALGRIVRIEAVGRDVSGGVMIRFRVFG